MTSTTRLTISAGVLLAVAAATDADIARVARPWVTTGVDPDGQPPRSPAP